MKPDQPFQILIPNFGEYEINLLPHQVVEYESQNPEVVVEADITYPEMLGLIPNDVDTEFSERHVDACNIATINK